MSVLASAGKVVAGTVLGVALAVTWNGQPHLEEVQEKTQNYVNKVVEMKAEYESVIEDKQIEINDIKGMYYDKEAEVEELKKQLAEANSKLEEANDKLEDVTNQNNANGNKNGLYKQELEKANADVEAHKEIMDEILDETIFE